jgi:hypothetical protein
MERIGPLLPVAAEAIPSEPVAAAAAQAGREATLAATRMAWERLHADGLMHPDCDLEWVIGTTSLLAAAETYMLMTRTLRWESDAYERWLYRTRMHFAITPGAAR